MLCRGDGSCLGRAPGLFRVLLCLQASLQGCVQPRRGCSSTPRGYTHGHGNFRGGLGYKWAGVFSETDPVPLHLPDAYGNPTAVVWLRFLMHQHSNCVRAQCSPLLLRDLKVWHPLQLICKGSSLPSDLLRAARGGAAEGCTVL